MSSVETTENKECVFGFWFWFLQEKEDVCQGWPLPWVAPRRARRSEKRVHPQASPQLVAVLRLLKRESIHLFPETRRRRRCRRRNARVGLFSRPRMKSSIRQCQCPGLPSLARFAPGADRAAASCRRRQSACTIKARAAPPLNKLFFLFSLTRCNATTHQPQTPIPPVPRPEGRSCRLVVGLAVCNWSLRLLSSALQHPSRRWRTCPPVATP